MSTYIASQPVVLRRYADIMLVSRNQRPDIQIVRAATLTCSRNHACAGSSFKRGCQVMKYGSGLISLGGSTKRTPSIGRTILVSFRGTVSTRSVFATANIAA